LFAENGAPPDPETALDWSAWADAQSEPKENGVHSAYGVAAIHSERMADHEACAGAAKPKYHGCHLSLISHRNGSQSPYDRRQLTLPQWTLALITS
jgi:hypothetical protein